MKLLRIAVLSALFPLSAAVDPPESAFRETMNRFAAEWNGFVKKLDSQVFDARAARRLSEDWHAIEHSGNWPREGR